LCRQSNESSAAAVLALALVSFFAMALHVTTDKRQPSVREVGEPLPVAMLDIDSLPSSCWS
jgi:hypothetical protein